MREYIAVKDFERFQHYKGRTPPWIKFYNALLDDYRFLQLSDAARSQLMLIWLVASRHNNRIPNDEKYIAEAIHCTSKLQLSKLLESGWLYLTTASDTIADSKQAAIKDASTLQAKRPQNAHLEVEEEIERETEIEKETETTPPSAPDEITAIAACFPNRVPAVQMLIGMTQGLGTPGMKAVPVEVLTEAMGELRTSGGEITPHRFKAFVRKILDRQRQEAEPKNGQNGHAGIRKGETTHAMKLVRIIREKRNPMFPNNVLPEWKEGLTDDEAQVVRTFGVTRILNDQNEGTVVAQLARALEESRA